MNKRLQVVLDLLQQSDSLMPEEKKSIADVIKEIDKEITITEFKLERTEKVKRTTGILLEQTIAELEQKRKSVETQNRELEIEASLERVRSRSMAMHHSIELAEVASALFHQLYQLGIINLRRFFVMIYDESNSRLKCWYTNEQGEANANSFSLPLNENPVIKKSFAAWKKREPISVVLSGTEMSDFVTHLLGNGYVYPKGEKQVESFVMNEYPFSFGQLNAVTYEPLVVKEFELIGRFARAFEQTYTRFLDLQKAEAQTREAQIEAALERVRSRTMAMQRSEELVDVASILFQQVKALGVPQWNCGFNIWEIGDKEFTYYPGSPDGKISPSPCKIPLTEHPVFISFDDSRKRGDELFVYEKGGEYQAEHYRYMLSLQGVGDLLQNMLDAGFQLPTFQIDHVANFSYGNLIFITYKHFPEMHDVFKRFAKVFEQTYTRFLDLQKAEAQAREAQIEASLERVRAKTMAMHNSKDLLDVIGTLSEQFQLLGFNIDSANFNTNYRQKDWDLWLYNPGFPMYPDQIHIPYFDHPYFNRTLDALAGGADFNSFIFTKEEKDQFLDHIYANTLASHASPERKKYTYDAQGFAWSVVYQKNTALTIANYDAESYSEEQNAILRRFGNVFEQTYTRFLDLQKAEAQAREAQIEASLERVRSRAMGMRTSDELNELIGTVFTELTKLDFTLTRCVIMIYDLPSYDSRWWMVNSEDPHHPMNFMVQDHDHEPNRAYISAWKEQRIKWTYELNGNVKKKWDDFLFSETELSRLPDPVIAGMKEPARVFLNASFNNFGNLTLATLEPLSDQHFEIMLRFAKVFDLTYTRFNDLKQAEAQTKEAQIEAALERVRARTMAMQKSDELADVAGLMFQQVKELGITAWTTGFNVWSDDNNTYTDYVTSPLGGFIEPYTIDTTVFPSFKEISDAKKRSEEFYVQYLEGEMLKQTYLELSKFGDKDQYVKMRDGGFEFPTHQFDHFVFLSNISLMFITYDPVPEAHDAFKRFGKVFEQTYTRFLDLKKAEEQAREAKIEASLERVRGKAMAMHSSEDLSATIRIFYRELESFSITPRRCGVGVVDKETRIAELSTMNTTDKGDSIEVIGKIKMEGHPVLEGIFDSWIMQQEYHPVLRGNEIKKYYQLVRPQISFPEYPNDAVQFGYFFPVPELSVYAWTDKELTEDELKIYRKFTSVLSLTHKRYKDLKDAEFRAKEAVKQATIDRVRAEIASMRTKQDLDRITPLIWTELTILGIPFVRCGVFIMDDKHQLVHTFLSTPEGKAIAAFQLNYDTHNLKEAIKHWHDNQIYVAHWGEKEFSEMAGTLQKQGSIVSRDQYLNTLPTADIYLHFLPFMQGMLYVGNITSLQQEDLDLVQSLAEAFSTAYARYEDFNQLEAAKQQVDRALVELKQTQQQLIQAEKMASLGELTAGIAHEIQNPLNFVNNFSEVSNELIDEMVEEVKNGNFDEAKVIANDLKQNLEKINHHGKRADGIVKSMLQHSRRGSSQKELTDINVLCDEYIRLSYHGLRAKDKSFNAKFETHFDLTLEKINVIPQDLGRVILNLINNAFYAVTEKRNATHNGYEPTVSVATKQWDDKVEIKITDNGNGIPNHIKEKIFQPFFTTKPTGQGTGLGLSLSYDIVKAHGGILKLETIEGEGSSFVIEIPNC